MESFLSKLAVDLSAFAPELFLCASVVLLLLLRMITALNRLHMGYVTLGLMAVTFVITYLQWTGSAFNPRENFSESVPLFTGLLVYDNFTIFLKLFLVVVTFLVIWMTLLTKIPDREDSADFYCLLLGSVIGMMLMASANHLLMVFIAIEMASLPSYAMAGFLKGKRQSSEAALKYVVYGGGAAGVMLYGISLLAGKFGTCYLPDLAEALVVTTPDPLLIMGVLFILIGFAFKLSAVPFHFWCPDVFEGAPAEIAGFLSVASKGAALALTGRFLLILTGMAEPSGVQDTWEKMAPILVPALAIIAAVTSTFGNLAAFPQTNLKRLLAYSTIAQAGYMIMGLVTMSRDGASAVLFYIVAYIFMNLGAFGIVAFLRNSTGSEDIRDFRGLVQRAPVLVISLGICFLGLLGMPPLVGFAAKFRIFFVLYESAETYGSLGMPGLSQLMVVLLFVLGINSVLSLVYYVNALKVMIIEKPIEEVEGREAEPVKISFGANLYSGLMAFLVLLLGILWNPLAVLTEQGTKPFQNPNVAESKSAESKQLAKGDRP